MTVLDTRTGMYTNMHVCTRMYGIGIYASTLAVGESCLAPMRRQAVAHSTLAGREMGRFSQHRVECPALPGHEANKLEKPLPVMMKHVRGGFVATELGTKIDSSVKKGGSAASHPCTYVRPLVDFPASRSIPAAASDAAGFYSTRAVRSRSRIARRRGVGG